MVLRLAWKLTHAGMQFLVVDSSTFGTCPAVHLPFGRRRVWKLLNLEDLCWGP
jgi:hypothetical protein